MLYAVSKWLCNSAITIVSRVDRGLMADIIRGKTSYPYFTQHMNHHTVNLTVTHNNIKIIHEMLHTMIVQQFSSSDARFVDNKLTSEY